MFVKTWDLPAGFWIGQVGSIAFLLLDAAEEFVCNVAGWESWGAEVLRPYKVLLDRPGSYANLEL